MKRRSFIKSMALLVGAAALGVGMLREPKREEPEFQVTVEMINEYMRKLFRESDQPLQSYYGEEFEKAIWEYDWKRT